MKTKSLKVLAVDVGKTKTGWCYFDKSGHELGSFATQSFINFHETINRVIDLWASDIIVVGKPNRYYNVISSHNRYIGVLCLIAEKQEIPLVELNDKSARAAVFPQKGCNTKEEIQVLTGLEDPDQSDAFVLAKAWYLLNQ